MLNFISFSSEGNCASIIMLCGDLAIADFISLILIGIGLFCCKDSVDDDGIKTLFMKNRLKWICKIIHGSAPKELWKARLFRVRYVFIPRVFISLAMDTAEVSILCLTNEEIFEEENLYLFILCMVFLSLQLVYFVIATVIAVCCSGCFKKGFNHILLVLLYKLLDMFLDFVLLFSVFLFHTGDFFEQLVGDMNIWSKIIIFYNATDFLITLTEVVFLVIKLCCGDTRVDFENDEVNAQPIEMVVRTYSTENDPAYSQIQQDVSGDTNLYLAANNTYEPDPGAQTQNYGNKGYSTTNMYYASGNSAYPPWQLEASYKDNAYLPPPSKAWY